MCISHPLCDIILPLDTNGSHPGSKPKWVTYGMHIWAKIWVNPFFTHKGLLGLPQLPPNGPQPRFPYGLVYMGDIWDEYGLPHEQITQVSKSQIGPTWACMGDPSMIQF